jgi:hypothetical protein
MNFGPAPVNAEGAGDGPRRTCEEWGDGAGGWVLQLTYGHPRRSAEDVFHETEQSSPPAGAFGASGEGAIWSSLPRAWSGSLLEQEG